MSQAITRIRQAESLFAAGRADEAKALLTLVLRSAPNEPDANTLMAAIHHAAGDIQRSVVFAERAAAARPDARTLGNLGQLLSMVGKGERAIRELTRAVAHDPANVDVRVSLAEALSNASRFVDAAEQCRIALRADPVHRRALSIAVSICVEMGRIDEGLALARRAVAAHPDDIQLRGQLCHILHYPHGLDPSEVAREHAAFGALLERLYPAATVTVPGDLDPERRLRVALVSGDFRTHSVAYFLEPWLEHHDRARFELFAFATGAIADTTTRRLASLVATFVPVGNATGDALAARIRADRPDIAIDLSGHTAAQTMLAMHLGVAPVQATYLGYAGTTGVRAISHRLVDSITDPPGQAHDALAVERLERLDPCFLCYRPREDAPPVAPPPSAADGIVRFGSFNAVAKLNRPHVELWSRLLRDVPGSRLVLKSSSFIDPALRAEIAARVTAWDVPPDRIDMLAPALAPADHLAQYAGVDIALDTFPYHGTTTTCEALHQGVPVVSLAGGHHAARVGASLLAAVGLPDLVARTPDEFVATAARLAADRARLGELRLSLRERLARSPLRDEIGFSRRFEDLLRRLWRERCAARPT